MCRPKTSSSGSKLCPLSVRYPAEWSLIGRLPSLLRIPRLQGGQEATLSADAELTATTHRQAWSRPPINIDFSVVMFTASGLLVRFLKVFEKGNYQSVKWVRYLTKAQGSYQVRVRLNLRQVVYSVPSADLC